MLVFSALDLMILLASLSKDFLATPSTRNGPLAFLGDVFAQHFEQIILARQI